jgi:hypothetical protein
MPPVFSRLRRGIALSALLALALPLAAAPPPNYRQRLGVYVWGKLSGGLEKAAIDAKILGLDRAVRVYIGPGELWDPVDPADNSPLDVKVKRSDYKTFLSSFPLVMITAYDAANYKNYKLRDLTTAELAATRSEFRRFGIELARTPGTRIISNWEFENDCKHERWKGCQAYYQARIEGIEAARAYATRLRLPGRLLTAFEFTIVPKFEGKPSGLVEVGSALKNVDYFSYSSWWSIGANDTPKVIAGNFQYAAKLIRDLLDSKKLTARLIIGEFGEYYDLHPSAERLKALVDASLTSGFDYVFNWVLYDQPGNKDEHGRDASRFGKFHLDRTLTPQGEEFRKWLGNPPIPLRAPGMPSATQ